MPPDVIQWQEHNITQVVALLEEFVWNIQEHMQTNPKCEMVLKTGMASRMLILWKINKQTKKVVGNFSR